MQNTSMKTAKRNVLEKILIKEAHYTSCYSIQQKGKLWKHSYFYNVIAQRKCKLQFSLFQCPKDI